MCRTTQGENQCLTNCHIKYSDKYTTDQIYENFLKDGKCETRKSCQHRHPKVWKDRQDPIEGCKHGEYCEYFHRNNVEAKATANKVEENMDVEIPDKTNNSERESILNTVNYAKRVENLEEELAYKIDTIQHQNNVNIMWNTK